MASPSLAEKWLRKACGFLWEGPVRWAKKRTLWGRGGGAQTMPVYISVARPVGGGDEEWDKFGAWEVIAGWWEVWMKAVRGESD